MYYITRKNKMTQKDFMTDLQTIYDALQRRQGELNDYYMLLKGGHEEADEVVEAFLKLLGLERNDDTVMAALTRIVNLREDALEQVLQKAGLDDAAIRAKKELAYGFVSMMHIARHERLISWIEEEKLLTPFYRALIFGVHFVGLRLSEWQSRWTGHILHGVNLQLSEIFDGDDARVFEMLQQHDLLDRDTEGKVADRCYSVLVGGLTSDDLSRSDESSAGLTQNAYRSAAYAEAFPDEVRAVMAALDQLIALLDPLEDTVFGQKTAWIDYFTALKLAFAHTETSELVAMWAEVDRRWMAITTPIQVGHPLEYYEDHYRKAVALEWDLRIVNPALQESSRTREAIKTFAYAMAKELGDDALHTITKNLLQVDQAQLYIGQPMLYYAAEFNGLFSAQVVPNDEQVSVELGKKIFAYADFVLQSQRSKPVMRLAVETFGEAFIRARRSLTQRAPDLWHRIYDISTIGHEFGHILWIDHETETAMNGSGQFKNIEEFKATTGGLMAFFAHEDAALSKHVTDDVVSRAVGLMVWREVGEVLPYYCEGLIHLELLFAAGVVRFDEPIAIRYDRYGAMKEHYTRAYRELAEHYLAKKDAGEYLNRYAVKEEGVYLPRTQAVRDFVERYYARYQAIGQQTVDWDEGSLYGDVDIEKVLGEHMDETDYLMNNPANREHLLDSLRQLDSGDSVIKSKNV